MDIEKAQAFTKLLLELMQKKQGLLEQVLNISYNQELVFSSTDRDQSISQEMMQEKESRIREIAAVDQNFQNIYGAVREIIEQRLDIFRPTMKQVKEQILQVGELELQIRLQEEKNRKLLLSKGTKKAMPKLTVNSRATAAQRYKQQASSTKKDSYSPKLEE